MEEEDLPLFGILSKKDKNGLYHLRNDEIEAYADNQLLEYQNDYFKKVRKIDAEDFCRFVTQSEVIYRSLADYPGKPLGLVMYVEGQKVVVIDKKACGYKPERIRFTILHETWHYQFDGSEVLMDSLKGISLEKEKQLREHYANQYAASVLMPKTFMLRLFDEFKSECSIMGDEKTRRFESFVRKVSKTLGVSFAAARTRANSLNLEF